MRKFISMFTILSLMFGLAFVGTANSSSATPIPDASVVPDALVKGTETNVQVAFTTPVDIPVDGKIIVIFPFQFGLTSSTGVTSSVLNGGLTHSIVSFSEFHITRDGDGQIIPSGTSVNDIELLKITTPPIEDYAGDYKIIIEDGGANVLASEIVSGQTFIDAQSVVSAPVSVTLSSPNGGETLMGGGTNTVSWISSGLNGSFRLEFSNDGGVSYSLIANDIIEETYSWSVPNSSITNAKIKVTSVDSFGNDTLSDFSDADFAVEFTPEVIVQDNPTDTIARNSLIKGESLSAVYFLAEDNKRYVFPSEDVFFSWYTDFNDVVTVSDTELATFALGSRITMAPGSLIKITSDTKVYAIDSDGSKRHVATESVAKSQFGEAWAMQVVDIDVTQWFDYSSGESIDATTGVFLPTKPAFPVE